VTTPKANIRRMADAVLPLHVTANDEGFISVIDTDGYFVLCLTPIQLAAIVRAVAVATARAWLGQSIPTKETK
jgi:hypothetical protein